MIEHAHIGTVPFCAQEWIERPGPTHGAAEVRCPHQPETLRYIKVRDPHRPSPESSP